MSKDEMNVVNCLGMKNNMKYLKWSIFKIVEYLIVFLLAMIFFNQLRIYTDVII